MHLLLQWQKLQQHRNQARIYFACRVKICLKRQVKPQAIRVKNKNILPDISVHGNWGIWGSWSVCSKICESGSQHRTRFCNDPETKHNGEHCSGRGYFVTSHDGYRRTDIKKQTMRQSCNVQNCPGK